MTLGVGVVIIVTITLSTTSALGRYKPTWESLDSRPLPQWYDDSKVGILLHWGVYSVPSYAETNVTQPFGLEEWFWWLWKVQKIPEVVDFMSRNYKPDFTYADFAPHFTAEFFDPKEWADIFQASGARYVVLTSKHHEGFSLWPSKFNYNWNSMDIGPKRDLVGELASAIRNKPDLHFGLYHSLYEWFNPLYLLDKKNKYKTQYFVAEKTMPELFELVNKYRPELIWSDGQWEASCDYWNSTHFLAWLYNDSPVKDQVIVNDRWGIGTGCHHGGYFTCEDRYNPKKLQSHKFENVWSIDKTSCGFRRNANLSDYFTISELLETTAETISCGGNILLNVGPTHDGRIAPVLEERLRQMGSWLKVNGEAIYRTKPWRYQQDDLNKKIWYTSERVTSNPTVYGILLEWPPSDSLILGNITATASTKVSMIGYRQSFTWTAKGSHGVIIQLPPIPPREMPSKWAWVFRFENIM